MQVVKLLRTGRVSSHTSGEGEDDPCHQMGVHSFVHKYPLLKQKSGVNSLI